MWYPEIDETRKGTTWSRKGVSDMAEQYVTGLRDDEETFTGFRRRRLLRTSFVLLVLGIVAGIVANLVLTANTLAIVLLSLSLSATIVAIVHYHLTKKIEVAAVTVTFIVVVSYLVYLGAARHSVFVLYLFPPVPVVAFYLTGRKKGAIFSLSAFMLTVVYLVWNRSLWAEAVFDGGSLTNFLVGTVAFLALVMCYELTIHKAQTSLRKINEALRMLSITDTLTGIHNREWLDAELDRRLENAKTGAGFSVMICDIDNFKRVNDEHGHIEGDNVLKAFAELLGETTSDDCRIGRWGGEEFLMVCEASDPQEATECAERVRRAVEEGDITPDGHLTVSVGVAVYEQKDTAVSIIRRADQGLYIAKAEGKNRVRCVKAD